MNRYQALNNAASLMMFGMLVVGLSKVLPWIEVDWQALALHRDSLLLAIFIVLYRVKMHYDDHKHFADFENEPGSLKYIGLLLAVFIWVLMGLSALTIDRPRFSATVLALSFGLSTIWIVVHLAELATGGPKGKKERVIVALRHRWVVANSLYVIALILYFGGAGPITVERWIFIALLFVVLLYDKIVSKPLSDGS